MLDQASCQFNLTTFLRFYQILGISWNTKPFHYRKWDHEPSIFKVQVVKLIRAWLQLNAFLMLASLPVRLLAYFPACLPVCLLPYLLSCLTSFGDCCLLLACLPACLLAFLPDLLWRLLLACLPACYLPVCLLACLPTCFPAWPPLETSWVC